MSETHVVVDAGKPTAIAVGYMATLHEATKTFEAAGFRGITDISFLESDLDCNEARRRALDAARRGEGKCWWEGDYEYGVWNRCGLYKFDYTSYDGPTFGGPATPDTKAHVDWRGN